MSRKGGISVIIFTLRLQTMPDLPQAQKVEEPTRLDASDWQKPQEGDKGFSELPKEPETLKETQETTPQTESPKDAAELKTQPPVQPQTAAAPQIIAAPKSPLRKDIEQTLSENINTFYGAMDAATKTAFKAKALETAGKIETMVQSGKLNVKKIISWIREWLQMIPGVNKLFLEQESKIKADKIVRLEKHDEPLT